MKLASKFSVLKLDMTDAQLERRSSTKTLFSDSDIQWKWWSRDAYQPKGLVGFTLSKNSWTRSNIFMCWSTTFYQRLMTGGAKIHGSFNKIWLPVILPKCARNSNGIRALQWPGSSPDKKFENLWHVLKRKLNKHQVKTRQVIIKQCVDILLRNDELKDIWERLVESMPRRVAECIKSKGGPLPHWRSFCIFYFCMWKLSMLTLLYVYRHLKCGLKCKNVVLNK